MVTVDTLAGIAIALVLVFIIMATVTFFQRRAAARHDAALTALSRPDWRLSNADELAAQCWGLSHPEWRALTDQERADYRARILRAPGWKRG